MKEKSKKRTVYLKFHVIVFMSYVQIINDITRTALQIEEVNASQKHTINTHTF